MQDMKFLWAMLLLGKLYTYNDTNDDDDANNDDDNAKDDDNDTWQTNHDCIGSFACMPNEPKSTILRPQIHILSLMFIVK